MFHNVNPGPAGVCLRITSVETAVRDFTSFPKLHFADNLTADPKAFKKIVIRLVRRGLPPKRGRPNDPQIDAAVRLVLQGKTVKDVLQQEVRGFEALDTYGRCLAENPQGVVYETMTL